MYFWQLWHTHFKFTVFMEIGPNISMTRPTQIFGQSNAFQSENVTPPMTSMPPSMQIIMAVTHSWLFKAFWYTSTQEKQTAWFLTEGVFLRKHLCCNARQSVITLIGFKSPYLLLMSCNAVRSGIYYHGLTCLDFKYPNFAVMMHTALKQYQNAHLHSSDFSLHYFSKALHMLLESCRILRNSMSANQSRWKMLTGYLL